MNRDDLRTGVSSTEASAKLTTRKKAPIWLFIVIGVVVVALIATIAIIVALGNSQSGAQKKITAAEKYLSDLDYDNAIASYKAAIEIDPTSLEAYLGLADVYIAMADELIGKAEGFKANSEADKAREAYEEAIGYYSEALEVLDNALDNVSDEDIKKAEKKKEEIEGYIDEAEDARDNGSEAGDSDADGSTGGNGDDTADGTGSGALDGSGTADDGNAQNITDDFTNSYIGGYVTFGSYEQDGDEANGPEPIEWEVLDINENGMLLVSKYVLDAHSYNRVYTAVTWENCTLRSWLNNDFLNKAFDSNEQLIINTTYVVNADNSYGGTEGGNDTYDKIFCLSVDEILKYYRFEAYYDEMQYGYCKRLMVEPTQYAINREVAYMIMQENDGSSTSFVYSNEIVGEVGTCWWLRSPGGSVDLACYVGSAGNVGATCNKHVSYVNYGIRPALYVQP